MSCRIVVAAARVDGNLGVAGLGTPRDLDEEAMEGQVGDLGSRIPDRHVEGPDRDASLAVATGLLPRHHGIPRPERVEVGSLPVHHIGGVQQTRSEPLPDETTLGESSDRPEAVADDRLSGPDDVGDHRHDRRGEAPGGNPRIPISRDRHGALADIDDAHGRWAYEMPSTITTLARPARRRIARGSRYSSERYQRFA
jgi:hypothetical protein